MMAQQRQSVWPLSAAALPVVWKDGRAEQMDMVLCATSRPPHAMLDPNFVDPNFLRRTAPCPKRVPAAVEATDGRQLKT